MSAIVVILMSSLASYLNSNFRDTDGNAPEKIRAVLGHGDLPTTAM